MLIHPIKLIRHYYEIPEAFKLSELIYSTNNLFIDVYKLLLCRIYDLNKEITSDTNIYKHNYFCDNFIRDNNKCCVFDYIIYQLCNNKTKYFKVLEKLVIALDIDIAKF